MARTWPSSPGLGSTEVSLLIHNETYNGETRSKVQFVNRPGGIAMKSPMTPEQAKAFAARMKGRVAQLNQKPTAACLRPATTIRHFDHEALF